MYGKELRRLNIMGKNRKKAVQEKPLSQNIAYRRHPEEELSMPEQTVDPDQTPRHAASDQGLHCLLRHPSIVDRFAQILEPVWYEVKVSEIQG